MSALHGLRLKRLQELRLKRYETLISHSHLMGVPDPRDLRDYFDGKCRLRVIDGTAILDYTQPPEMCW